ncbi:HlyD family type I secretion periplasmic adaptor subunit [Aeromonas dhakensis]|uniref:HlyD family type I secretion periplasmic adaptor subunit n=1 Tax=Aeromonas dhakensis TaxID=196024 RepID=UPI00244128D5|nr:HlyD family type I secretion periplasmic adaptor subunit [Aeromonas dhakensis]
MKQIIHPLQQAWHRLTRYGSTNHEREFLPAALEILDTPASPAGRTLGYLIVLFFSLALIWACTSRVDVTSVAPGQLVPVGGTKAIQPYDKGIVRRILVEDGQHVVAGQLLVELDSTEDQVDLSQLQRQEDLVNLDMARLQALLASLDGEDGTMVLQDGANSPQALRQQQRLAQRLSAYRAKEASLHAQLQESQSALAAGHYEIEKLQARLPVVTEKAKALASLLKTHASDRFKWLDMEQERMDTVKSLAVEKEKTKQHQASVARIEADLIQFRAETRHQALAELLEAQDKAKEVHLSIRRYQEREQYRFLRAPVTGRVQQLAVHTQSGVVQAAQVLMVIAPDDAPLAVDAKVLNRDIGFVQAGQEVSLKVESYPYTKYGTLSGKVEYVSRDSIPDEKLGAVYQARIHVDNDWLTKTGVRLPVQPGMTVSAEIKTDSRRVIDYLLSPVEDVFSDSIHER